MSSSQTVLKKEDVDKLKSEWEQEQNQIATQLVFQDCFDWTLDGIEAKTQVARGGKLNYRTPTQSDISSEVVLQSPSAIENLHMKCSNEKHGKESDPQDGARSDAETKSTVIASQSASENTLITEKRPLRYIAGVDISFFGCHSAIAARKNGLLNASGNLDSEIKQLESSAEQQSEKPLSGETINSAIELKQPLDTQKTQDESIEMACASLVIQKMPDFTTVYQDYIITPLNVPYVSGFLAFREVPILLTLFERLEKFSKKADPSSEEAKIYPPDVVFTDGNGSLHPRGCGVACHLGVATGLPTIGVAKKVANVDGINRTMVENLRKELLENHNQSQSNSNEAHLMKTWAPLIGNSGRKWGAMVFTSKHSDSTCPVFVSPGHRISLESAVKLAQVCSIHRIVEPIRCADLGSRDLIRRYLETND